MMIDREDKLPVSQQAKLLKISRGTVYYTPRPMCQADLTLMRRIDELHLEYPFMGQRMLMRQLKRMGVRVGRVHMRTLMLRMGISAMAPQPGTSRPAPGRNFSGNVSIDFNGFYNLTTERHYYYPQRADEDIAGSFEYMGALGAGGIGFVNLSTQLTATGGGSGFTYIDPYIFIDPIWAADNPGYSVIVSDGVGNQPFSAVPEPESLALTLAALGALAITRQRRLHGNIKKPA